MPHKRTSAAVKVSRFAPEASSSSTTAAAARTKVVTRAQFNRIRELAYRMAGIALGDDKLDLVSARLYGLVHKGKIESLNTLIRSLGKADPKAQTLFVEALTTHTTSFFRESRQFDLLGNNLIPTWARLGKALTLWSAGCSYGHEPYSLTLLLANQAPALPVRILASDISTKALAVANEGRYENRFKEQIPPALYQAYTKMVGSSHFQFIDTIREPVVFAQLNLMQQWPMRHPFDAIFCRNVMIYFDLNTRTTLARRFHERLKPKGLLFVGSCESLPDGCGFTSLGHSVYRRDS